MNLDTFLCVILPVFGIYFIIDRYLIRKYSFETVILARIVVYGLVMFLFAFMLPMGMASDFVYQPGDVLTQEHQETLIKYVQQTREDVNQLRSVVYSMIFISVFWLGNILFSVVKLLHPQPKKVS